MTRVQYLATELSDPSRLGPGRAVGEQWSPWSADADPAASEAVEARNRAIVERLGSCVPGLTSTKDALAQLEDLADETLSQEQVLRRFQRARVVSGPWQDGEMVIQIYDDIVGVVIPVSRVRRSERAALAADLERLLECLIDATGMVPWDRESGERRSACQAVESLLQASSGHLDRLARANRRQRLLAALGVPSLVILTLLALSAAVWLGWYGLKRGALVAGVDRGSTATFVTDSMPPPDLVLGFIPDYALDGHILDTGERVRLPVFRAEYLRSGPAAPYTVMQTHNADTPYILRTYAEGTGPVIAIGETQIAWMALIAPLPLVLWHLWVLRPILRMPPARRPERLAEVTKKLRVLILGLAAAGVIVYLKT